MEPGTRISSLYLSALRLPSIMTRLVLPLREMPPIVAVDFVKKNWSASHMFSSVAHSTNAGSVHAVPHWKGDKSMIKMVSNTIPIGFIKGEL